MVQGVIQRVNDKQWNGKTFFSIALSGQDGWYNTGVKRPPAVGTSVKFNEKTNAKGYKEVDGSIEILADGIPGPAQSAAVAAGATNTGLGEGNKKGYYDRKDARDLTNDAARELGASRNTAIAIIDLALKNEVIKLPAAAKREEFLWILLDKYTAKLMGKEDTGLVPEKVSGAAEQASSEDPQSDHWS